MSDAADIVANPWPGLASYTEDQRHLFFGRGEEIVEVARLVQRETLTVLFGRSGLGKSSLLRAGVMPRLREQGFFPVTLRLDFADRAAVAPVEQFKALTVAAARQAGVELENLPDDGSALTLWEWFHTVEFWGPRNDPVTPILALDQFEEVFTLGRNLPQTGAFIEQLADLIENRVPQAVRDRVEQGGERPAYHASRQQYKIVLSLREDFVPKLDSLRPVLPAIMRNRFALAPLDAACARAVVLGAGRTWISEEDAGVIVAAVAGGDGDALPSYRPDDEVEPAYLSVMCHELFRRMQALGRSGITRDLIAAERGGILEGLYTRSFEGIGDPVRCFVEDRLLTPSGYRGTLPLADATQEGIAAADLHTLVDRRLLRFEDRLGTIHMELSHDLLTSIVLKRRDSRRAEAAAKMEAERTRQLRAAQLAQRRRSRVVAGVAVALAVLLVGTLWGGYYCFLQEHRASYRNVVSRRGFPSGLGELSAAQARRLPLHYVFVYKGLAWDGWRLRWKPPSRMMAVDQRGRLTTNHGIGTYFWRAHDEWQPLEASKERGTTLGLSAVCQWEYVADAQGDIAYERGLDRGGRMVYACVYSPTAADSTSARIAHFVGPDGFPQLQDKSAAEYVEIHYDAAGNEERVLYLDALAQPATGPDGEFGAAKEHDRAGRLLSVLALDEHGRPMIDRLGKAGMRFDYGKDGLVSEITALGTDQKIADVTDGWARIKDAYDAAGRLVRIESFDANGQPAVRRLNFCGIEERYNGDGELVADTFLGPDGAPRAISGEAVGMRHEYDSLGNEVRTTFLDRAGHPTRGKDGYCGYASTFDARGNLVARTMSDAAGRPFLMTDGYAGWKSEFDDLGRETRRTHFGVAGEPVTVKGGFHGWVIRFDARGNPVRHTYLGTDGKPTFSEEQIAGWEAAFDPRGREVSRRFLGAAGEPVLHADGNAGYTTEYDAHGNEAARTTVDLRGKPFALNQGFATTKLEHDLQGHETKRTCFDAAGKPVLLKDGSHGTLTRYDERGDAVEVTTVDSGGLPVDAADGYAIQRKTYNRRSDIVEQRYFDADGKPARNGGGVFVVQSQYTVQGWLTGERYRDAEGKPMLDRKGIHYWVIGHDAVGNDASFACFGLHDEPVPGIHATCAKKNRYDERNNVAATTWYGADGKPAANEDGYASARMEFDPQNNLVATAYFDANGQPCLPADKVHRWVTTFDRQRRAARWEYFGTHGEPVLAASGYAKAEAEYDAAGRETMKRWFGVDGKPILLPSYYASCRRSYAPAGQTTRIDYGGVNDEKVLCDGGFCTYSADYGGQGELFTRTWVGLPGLTAFQTQNELYVDGWVRSMKYLDADYRPVNNAGGTAAETLECDDAGALQRYAYFDAEGRPACGERGFVSANKVNGVWKYHDAAGVEIPDIEHDGVRPLLYVVFLRTPDCAAAKSGLQPGDLIWQLGDFYYPDIIEAIWKKDADFQTAKTHLFETWKAALGSELTLSRRLVVIRAGRLVELDLPAAPPGSVGVNSNLRRVPTRDYEDLVKRFGKLAPPAS